MYTLKVNSNLRRKIGIRLQVIFEILGALLRFKITFLINLMQLTSKNFCVSIYKLLLNFFLENYQVKFEFLKNLIFLDGQGHSQPVVQDCAILDIRDHSRAPFHCLSPNGASRNPSIISFISSCERSALAKPIMQMCSLPLMPYVLYPCSFPVRPKL